MSEKNPAFITFRQMITEPLSPVEWAVEPLIGKGDRAIYCGEPGSFKTYTLLHLSLHLAAGQTWLGNFSIPEPLPVLYLDCEIGSRRLQRGAVRVAQGAGIVAADLPFMALSGWQITFDKNGAEKLLQALDHAPFNPKVIIVETLRRVLAGDEREAKDIAAFWNNIEPLREGDRTIIISHHLRKYVAGGNNAAKDRVSGSTDLPGGCEDAFTISRIGDLARLEQTKNRNTPEYHPFFIGVTDKDPQNPDCPMLIQFAGTAAARKTKADSVAAFIAAYVESQIADEIWKEIFTSKEVLKHLEEVHKVPHSTAEKGWRAWNDQHCDKVGRGKYRLKTQPQEVVA